MSKLLKSKLTKIVLGFVVAVLVVGFAAPQAKALDAGQCAGAKAALVALGIPASTADTILAAQCGGSPSVSYTFTKSLKQGMTDPEVMSLQKFLNSDGCPTALSGVGSSGYETSYFGAKTKAAVMCFQAKQGVSPVSGYWGPLTRAAAQAWMASHAGTGGTGTGTGGTGTGTGTGGTSTGPVTASIASDSPTGSAIAGAGQIDSMKFNITASSAGGDTLTGLTFKKVGVLSDTQISNLYIADENGVVIAQFQSLSGGVATFANMNIQVNAGMTRKLTLRTDLSTGAAAGNTIQWQLSGGTLASNATLGGLPVNGNTLTVTTVSNPSIATATFTFNAVGTTVDAGTTGVQLSQVTANVQNSAVWLKSIKFSAVGSANWADIKNVKLVVNGTQAGTALTQVASDGTAVFALATPVQLNTGNSTLQLFGDVMGSPFRSVQLTLLRPYDINVVDSQYNSGINPSIVGSGTQITINQGQITVTQASDTPTGNVAVGVSNVTLAKFNIYASGEAVKVKFLDANIVSNSSTATFASLRNVKIIDNAGNQVGSTISTPASGSTTGTCTATSTTATCHFGDSSSNINYIVPANTTRTLSLVADIQSTSTVTTLQGTLPGGPSSNLEGQTSFQTTTSGSANGAVLTVISSSLTPSANSSVSTQTYAAGATNKRIGSFVLTASSAQGANVSSMTLNYADAAGSAAGNLNLQNVKVMVGSTQFGATRSTINDGSATSMAFSGSTPIMVPAGGSVTVDVYGDILSSTTSGNTYPSTSTNGVIELTGWSAIGSVSSSSINFPGTVEGQRVTVSSGPTLTVSQNISTPAGKVLAMSSTGNNLFALDLAANNIEDVKVTDLILTDTIGSGSAGHASFKNMTLWDGSTQIGGPLSMTIVSTSTTPATVHFTFTSPIVVPRNSTKTVTLQGDLGAIGDAVAGSTHAFSVNATSTDVIALGKDSNSSAIVSGTPGSNTFTVAQGKLSLSAAQLGVSTGRGQNTQDDLGQLTFSATGNQITVNTVSVRFSGNAISGVSSFTASLLKSDNTAWVGSGGSNTATCTVVGNSCTATFSPLVNIQAGQSSVAKVAVNSTATGWQTTTSNFTAKFNGSISSTGNVTYGDGVGTYSIDQSDVPNTFINTQY
jgi:hypothetical protein